MKTSKEIANNVILQDLADIYISEYNLTPLYNQEVLYQVEGGIYTINHKHFRTKAEAILYNKQYKNKYNILVYDNVIIHNTWQAIGSSKDKTAYLIYNKKFGHYFHIVRNDKITLYNLSTMLINEKELNSLEKEFKHITYEI